MEETSSLGRFTKSKTGTVLIFLVILAGFAIFTYLQPWAHPRHVERQTPLPANYTHVSLEPYDTAYYPVMAYVEERFGPKALVQKVQSIEIYNKIFPAGQEHIVFTGKQHAGLMTVDKSIIWIYEDSWIFSPTTFSIANNTLTSHIVIERGVVGIILSVTVFPFMCYFICKVGIDTFWDIRLQRRRKIQTEYNGAA